MWALLITIVNIVLIIAVIILYHSHVELLKDHYQLRGECMMMMIKETLYSQHIYAEPESEDEPEPESQTTTVEVEGVSNTNR